MTTEFRAPEPGNRVDEVGVYRSFRRMLPGLAITDNGTTKPAGNCGDKGCLVAAQGIYTGKMPSGFVCSDDGIFMPKNMAWGFTARAFVFFKE